MLNAINNIKNNNPEFKHYLFDDDNCRRFIKNKFSVQVFNAYNSLIPGAYKADLWRYCVLYIYGGIYLDIKYEMYNNFKLVDIINDEHYVLDDNKKGIYNGFMVSKPGNTALLNAISMIVENVKKRNYGNSFLEPTGPLLLSKIIPLNNNKLLDMRHLQLDNDNNKKVIMFNNIIILKSYNGHTEERDKYSKIKHYGILWKERKIYKN